MNKKRLWIAVGFLILLVLAGSGWHVYRGFRGLLIGEQDRRALVVPVEALADYGVVPACGTPCGRYGSQHKGDALQVDYQYDDSGRTADPLYISSTALLSWSEYGAWQNYWSFLGGFQLGMLGERGRVTLEEVHGHTMTLGDKRYWARVRNEHGIVGDMVLVRQGRTVLAYVIIGVHFEKQADLEDLLRPAVQKAAALQKQAV